MLIMNKRGNAVLITIISFLVVVLVLETSLIFSLLSRGEYKVNTMIKRAYQKGVYDCDNISNDFAGYLNDMGYRASVIVGYNLKVSDNIKHAWVQVEDPLMIEPQTGQIINISSFDENYKMTGWYEYR